MIILRLCSVSCATRTSPTIIPWPWHRDSTRPSSWRLWAPHPIMRFRDRQARGKPDLQERLSCSHRNRSRSRHACVCGHRHLVVVVGKPTMFCASCSMCGCVSTADWVRGKNDKEETLSRVRGLGETRERHSTAAFLSLLL